MNIAPSIRAAALGLLLVGAPAARADWIAWTYSWSNSPQTILADNPAGGGSIILTNEPTLSAVGNTDIVATNIHTYSTASQSAPDTFTNKPYTLTLTLTDSASGQSGSATFTGAFNGTLTANSSNITNTFTSPTTVVMDLGTNEYSVTLTAYTPPGPTGSINAGAIGAHATVTVEPIHIVEQTPEPSTILLAILAAPVALWRLRHSAVAGSMRRRSQHVEESLAGRLSHFG
jgi:hypothetical protein